MMQEKAGQGDMWPTATAPQRDPRSNGELFRMLDADLFLAHQLFRHGLGLSASALDHTLNSRGRMEKIRAVILANDMAQRPVLRGSVTYDNLVGVTLEDAFAKLYGEPLQHEGE